jgi:hypothetical protein
MITINTTDVDERTVIICLNGRLLPGSAGNVEAQKLKRTIECVLEKKTRAVLNLLDLSYSSGDYFGMVFFTLIQNHLKFNVVAKGITKDALQNLIKSSGIDRLTKINFYDDFVEALGALEK